MSAPAPPSPLPGGLWSLPGCSVCNPSLRHPRKLREDPFFSFGGGGLGVLMGELSPERVPLFSRAYRRTTHLSVSGRIEGLPPAASQRIFSSPAIHTSPPSNPVPSFCLAIIPGRSNLISAIPPDFLRSFDLSGSGLELAALIQLSFPSSAFGLFLLP